jgi:hypothetical protein
VSRFRSCTLLSCLARSALAGRRLALSVHLGPIQREGVIGLHEHRVAAMPCLMLCISLHCSVAELEGQEAEYGQQRTFSVLSVRCLTEARCTQGC